MIFIPLRALKIGLTQHFAFSDVRHFESAWHLQDVLSDKLDKGFFDFLPIPAEFGFVVDHERNQGDGEF